MEYFFLKKGDDMANLIDTLSFTSLLHIDDLFGILHIIISYTLVLVVFERASRRGKIVAIPQSAAMP